MQPTRCSPRSRRRGTRFPADRAYSASEPAHIGGKDLHFGRRVSPAQARPWLLRHRSLPRRDHRDHPAQVDRTSTARRPRGHTADAQRGGRRGRPRPLAARRHARLGAVPQELPRAGDGAPVPGPRRHAARRRPAGRDRHRRPASGLDRPSRCCRPRSSSACPRRWASCPTSTNAPTSRTGCARARAYLVVQPQLLAPSRRMG